MPKGQEIVSHCTFTFFIIIGYSNLTLIIIQFQVNFFLFDNPHLFSHSCWLNGFYGIPTFVGHLMPNPFLCCYSVLSQTIQFNRNTHFNCQKHFHFKLFSLVKQFYFKQFSSIKYAVLMSKQFYSKQFNLVQVYSLIVKNISTSSNLI